MTNVKNEFDYNNFYELMDPLATRPFRLNPQQKWVDQEMVNGVFYGLRQPPEPISFKPYRGRLAADILWSTFPPLMCVSQNIVDILTENQFKGWGTYPVVVFNREGTIVPGYYGFSVKSYAGAQDFSRGTKIMKSPAPGIKPSGVFIGTFFDEGKWDGSDIFRIQHAVIIMSKQVVQAFKKNKIINARLTPLPETETSAIIYESIINMRV